MSPKHFILDLYKVQCNIILHFQSTGKIRLNPNFPFSHFNSFKLDHGNEEHFKVENDVLDIYHDLQSHHNIF